MLATPFLVCELPCSCLDCRKNDFVHIFSLKFQRHQGFVCTTCFAVTFWNLFLSLWMDSLKLPQRLNMGHQHALLGLPLCCIAREIGSKAFCYLCCMENGSFSVCDNLNHPCLISFFTATVIPQPVPRFLFLEINHFLDLSSVGCAPSLFLSDDNSHSSAQHISLSPASAPGHSLPSQAAEGWQG